MCKYEFSKERFMAVEHNELKMQDYCVAQKWHVIPTTRLNEGKDCAPVFASQKCEVTPDFLVMAGNGKVFFVEVKTAETSPFNRTYDCNVLGIKKTNYYDYLDVAKATGIDVMLVFVLANKYILTGNILTLPEPYNCLCRGCRNGDECNAEGLVYWNVRDLWRNLVLENWYFNNGGK